MKRNWDLIVGSVMAVLLVAVMGLCGPPDCGAQDPIGTPAVNTMTPQPIPDEFTSWANATMRVLSERFQVPEPQWDRRDRMPATAPYCGKIATYDPARSVVITYKQMQLGQPLPIDEQKHVFLHGFLHHVEKCRGVAFPPLGHEAEYDRWLQTLGMWRR